MNTKIETLREQLSKSDDLAWRLSTNSPIAPEYLKTLAVRLKEQIDDCPYVHEATEADRRSVEMFDAFLSNNPDVSLRNKKLRLVKQGLMDIARKHMEFLSYMLKQPEVIANGH